MPAFSSLTINDGQATPVAHVFSPATLVGTEAKYMDRSSGITVGFPVITTNVSLPSKNSKLTKVRLKVVSPVLEVVNSSTYSGITPAPTRAYDMTFDCTFFLPERSSLAQRKDILAYARNLLASIYTASLIETQETVY